MSRYFPLKDDEVIVYKNYIVIGNGIKRFFFKKQISTVTLILDYKNKSIILWGDLDTDERGFDSGEKGEPYQSLGIGANIPRNLSRAYITAGRVGNSIIYPIGREGGYTDAFARIKSDFAIQHLILNNYKMLDVRLTAKPLNDQAVVINNAPLKDGLNFRKQYMIYANMTDGFIVCGNYHLGHILKSENLQRKLTPIPIKNLPTSSTQRTPQTSQIKAPMRVQTSPIAPRTREVSRPMITPKPEKSVPTEAPRAFGDVLDDYASQADIDEIMDRRYKKMILGE
jgi:hypothetical protein